LFVEEQLKVTLPKLLRGEAIVVSFVNDGGRLIIVLYIIQAFFSNLLRDSFVPQSRSKCRTHY